jgi:glycosyltransferase involved in cell wall biosynthesis
MDNSLPPACGRDRVWIVVPAYNEARRLGETLRGLCPRWPNVVVVDDGSVDGTAAAALAHPVWLLRHVINCGQGAALQTGIDFALRQGAEVVVTFDADGQHAAEEVGSLVEPVLGGQAEVALGSRFLGRAEGLPWTRWLVLKLGVLFTRAHARLRVTDTHNGFRALSGQAARRIRITHNRMAHASEILDQVRAHGLRYCEVPVRVRYTAATLAKGQTSWQALKIAAQLVLGRVLR